MFQKKFLESIESRIKEWWLWSITQYTFATTSRGNLWEPWQDKEVCIYAFRTTPCMQIFNVSIMNIYFIDLGLSKAKAAVDLIVTTLQVVYICEKNQTQFWICLYSFSYTVSFFFCTTSFFILCLDSIYQVQHQWSVQSWFSRTWHSSTRPIRYWPSHLFSRCTTL